MAMAQTFEGLDEILKVPLEKQHSTVVDKLKARRKELADIFFKQETPKADKIKIQDELAKLHDYLKMKPIRKIGEARPPATAQQREQNTLDFMAFAVKNGIHPTAESIAIVWGSVK